MKENKFAFQNFDEDITVILRKTHYESTGNIALIAFTEDGEYWSDVTINVEKLQDEYQTTLDTNNNGKPLLDALEAAKVFTNAGYHLTSGFCQYPVAKLNPNWLEVIPAL